MDLPNLWLWSGLHIGPQLMDSLSTGRSPSRSKEEEKENMIYDMCKYELLCHGFRKLSSDRQTDRQTRPKLYTKPLHGWPITAGLMRHKCVNKLYEVVTQQHPTDSWTCCCSMEIEFDTVYFKATTEGLSVPHLMCQRTKVTLTTTRHQWYCGKFGNGGTFFLLFPSHPFTFLFPSFALPSRPSSPPFP